MDQVYQQDLSQESPRPGGPFLIQMLFREPTELPYRDTMLRVLQQHCGRLDCFCHDEKRAGFAALDHMATFQDGSAPVQLMVTACSKIPEDLFDPFTRSQMWDCMGERDQILAECRWQIVGVDMLTAALDPLERADLDMDFLEALAELFPTCVAFYFQNCGKLLKAEEVRGNTITGPDRFIRFGVNARFFNIQGTDDMLVDTLGMSTLFLPDLQYHFHNMDPNWVVGHAYSVASYLLLAGNPIQDGETVDGVLDGAISQEVQWKCQHEGSLIQPPREVLDIFMGEYASGTREN